MFKKVCLGGTFDGIHSGHKLLFNEALKLCNNTMVVGVTNIEMIKTKTLWELIAPVDVRIKTVENYLKSIEPKLDFHVVAINDIYGPTIEMEELECIVVSEETIRGAHKINEARVKKGWNELKIHVVNLVQEEDPSKDEAMSRLKENKISSSTIRLEKLGTILKEPITNSSIPDRPYLIGLTGGVASGKTAISNYLQTFGFGYISYDQLGHKTYSSIESPTYKKIIEYFDESILDPNTRLIDRGKLGSIVFKDRSKLDKLNEIVWPAIYSLVDEELARMKDQYEVIVLESALLVETGQTSRVHQVWTTIVPPDEAVKRQMKDRGLSEVDARRRVESQVDNLKRVQVSNVVFCSLWEPEFTQKQVRKCVDELRKRYLVPN